MKALYFIFSLTVPLLHSSALAQQTHCKNGETELFNCPVKNSKKVASLCSSSFDYENKIPGYLQYRFGRIGNVEFYYPEKTDIESQKNKFYSDSGIAADQSFTESNFAFKSGQWMYKLNYREDDRNTKTPTKESSVEVWKGMYGKKMQNYKLFECATTKDNDGISLMFELQMLNSHGFKFKEY